MSAESEAEFRRIDYKAEREAYPAEFQTAKEAPHNIVDGDGEWRVEFDTDEEDRVVSLYRTEGDDPEWYGACPCESFAEGRVCKHLFAVRLNYFGDEYLFDPPPDSVVQQAAARDALTEAEETMPDAPDASNATATDSRPLSEAGINTDPLDVVPSYMVDTVEGQPTINKRGYAVIANRFDIVVQADPVTRASETDFEYAEFEARAWHREDGPENAYTGFGTARRDESGRGGINPSDLNEMAETRAMKRAVAWASGIGILAWEEIATALTDDEEGDTE